tara:strand:- start:2574 stop:3530 length:957 start_codon:yes stop_codon:yes gene_type:complete
MKHIPRLPLNWQLKLTKVPSILKISVFLSLVTIFSSFSNNKVYSQTEISINVENTEIINILDIIESTTDLRFFYDNDIYNFNEKKSLALEKVGLEKAIVQIFGGSIGFTMSENVVVLEKANIVFINDNTVDDTKDLEQVDSQRTIINGNVTDIDGNPLPGASVIENGTENEVTTDFDGNFTIELENENAELQFSYVGFKTQIIAVGSSEAINVILLTDATLMDEVIVTVGYGLQKKANLTGAVETINSDVLENRPVNNVSNLLAGQVPGITAISGGGQPGLDQSQISIRGNTTYGASSLQQEIGLGKVIAIKENQMAR